MAASQHWAQAPAWQVHRCRANMQYFVQRFAVIATCQGHQAMIFCRAAGGLFIGAASWALEVLAPSSIPGAVAAGSVSSGSAFAPGAFGAWNLLLGLLGGAAGNAIDSVAGALLQFSGLDFR